MRHKQVKNCECPCSGFGKQRQLRRWTWEWWSIRAKSIVIEIATGFFYLLKIISVVAHIKQIMQFIGAMALYLGMIIAF